MAGGAIVLFPRAAPVVLLFLVFFAVGDYFRSARAWSWRRMITPIMLVWSAAIIYLLLNSSWSLDLSVAYQKVGELTAILVVLFFIVHHLEHLESATLARAARALLAGLLLGAVIIFFEIISGHALTKFLFNLVPPLIPDDPKDYAVVDGVLVKIGAYELNWNVAVLTLLFWPVILIISVTFQGPRRWFFVALFGFCAIGAVALSKHETSQLAVLAGLTMFGFSRLVPKMSPGLLAAVWLAATLLMVPLATFTYSNGLHMATWLPDTARARIILWDFTAEQVAKKPLFGHGLRSTRRFDDTHRARAEIRPGHVFARRTGRHAHNIYMQTWFELGAIGALFLSGLGLLVLHRITILPSDVQPYFLATFVSFYVIAAFSWGMWQSWYMASFAITAVFSMFAIMCARRE